MTFGIVNEATYLHMYVLIDHYVFNATSFLIIYLHISYVTLYFRFYNYLHICIQFFVGMKIEAITS